MLRFANWNKSFLLLAITFAAYGDMTKSKNPMVQERQIVLFVILPMASSVGLASKLGMAKVCH